MSSGLWCLRTDCPEPCSGCRGHREGHPAVSMRTHSMTQGEAQALAAEASRSPEGGSRVASPSGSARSIRHHGLAVRGKELQGTARRKRPPLGRDAERGRHEELRGAQRQGNLRPQGPLGPLLAFTGTCAPE